MYKDGSRVQPGLNMVPMGSKGKFIGTCLCTAQYLSSRFASCRVLGVRGSEIDRNHLTAESLHPLDSCPYRVANIALGPEFPDAFKPEIFPILQWPEAAGPTKSICGVSLIYFPLKEYLLSRDQTN